MDTTSLIRIVAGLLFLLLYFLPSVIGRDRRNARAIFLVNLLTGWSVIGWVVALIWALTNDSVPAIAVQPQVAVQPSAQGNARVRKFGFLALIAATLLLAIIFGFWLHNSSNSPDTSAAPITSAPSVVVATYHDSNEILDPYDLSKNPYKWKDHSGILDTIEVPVIMGNGARMGQVTYPGGCLKFSKMIDEHTAIYEVMVAHEEVGPDGEIAVLLADSDPPSSLRPWRVFVEGPMEALSGLGQTITLTAIRFEGYYSPPASQPASATPSTDIQKTQPSEQTIKWTAMSNTAESITGDVETSSGSIAMPNGTFLWSYVRDLNKDELTDSAELFSLQVPSTLQNIEGRLFATHIPASVHLVNGNTICGTENVTWAVVVKSHGVETNSTAGDQLGIAFFSGDAQPTLQPQAIGDSKALCGTFSYQEAKSNQISTVTQ